MQKKENNIFFLPVLFSMIQVIILSVAYIAARTGFGFHLYDVLKSVGLVLFLLITPIYASRFFQNKNTETWFNGNSFLFIILFFLIILIGFICDIFNFNLGMIISSIGLIFLLKFLFDGLKAKSLINNLKIIWLPAIILGTWTVGNIWGWGFQNPLYFEGMTVGKGHIDMLYLSSISQMIRTYFIPSIGIDGLLFRHYHFGSNVVAASLSSLLNIPVLQFYQLTFPLLLTSLFSFSFFNLLNKVRNIFYPEAKWNPVIIWIFVIGIIGIMPEKTELSFVILKNIFTSESYSLALSLAFLFTEIFLSFWFSVKNNTEYSFYEKLFLVLIIPIVFFIIGITKVSVGFVLLIAFIYFIFRFKLFKRLYFVSSTIFSLAAFVIVFKMVSGFSSTYFSLFSFVKDFATGNPLLFFPVYFLFPIIYFFIRIKQTEVKTIAEFISTFKQSPRSYFDIELVFLFVITGALPGLLFYIHGAGASYFSDVQRWLCLFLIMYLAISNPGLFEFRKNIFSVLVFTYLFWVVGINTYSRIKSFVAINYQIRKEIAFNSLKYKKDANRKYQQLIFVPGELIKQNPKYRLFSKLCEADKLSQKEKSKQFVFIPKSDSLFWKSMPVEKISFIVPALTGMAMIYGTPPVSENHRKNNEVFSNYGYDDYIFEENNLGENEMFKKVQSLGKTKLWIANTDSNKITFKTLTE